MADTVGLSRGEKTRIYQVQAGLGITPSRMAHIRQTVTNYFHLVRGRFGALYSALSRENQAIDNRSEYIDHLRWLQNLIAPFSPAQLANLEAGVRLHDIGYSVTPGGDHPEAGYELLRGPGGEKIWSRLRLSPSIEPNFITMMAKYHGFLTDVGFLYSAEMVQSFSDSDRAALTVMCALDSTTKPLPKGGFHSMLFLRILRRYKQLIEQGNLPPEGRLQQLFGPINFNWLKDTDFDELMQAVDREGLRERRGFSILLSCARFIGWPLLKDLVTPEVTFANSYYTELHPPHIKHLVRLISLTAQIAERVDPGAGIDFDVPRSYMDFKNRPSFLATLRSALESSEKQVTQTDASSFAYDRITFKIGGKEKRKNVLIEIA